MSASTPQSPPAAATAACTATAAATAALAASAAASADPRLAAAATAATVSEIETAESDDGVRIAAAAGLSPVGEPTSFSAGVPPPPPLLMLPLPPRPPPWTGPLIDGGVPPVEASPPPLASWSALAATGRLMLLPLSPLCSVVWPMVPLSAVVSRLATFFRYCVVGRGRQTVSDVAHPKSCPMLSTRNQILRECGISEGVSLAHEPTAAPKKSHNHDISAYNAPFLSSYRGGTLVAIPGSWLCSTIASPHRPGPPESTSQH